jgi:MinD-like ATPase involved in chromosome partitioning or flagellar assembly
MGSIITVHSYRRGTGKSFVAANLAAILASQGLQVGIVDSNSRFPSLQYFFQLRPAEVEHSLHDYIFGRCEIMETIVDVSGHFQSKIKGRVLLVPSIEGAREAMRIPHEGYDIERLFKGFNLIINSHSLDILLIDTSAGLNDDSLPYIAGANVLVEIMRPDRQDLSGTATVIFTAQKLDVPKMLLVMNQIPAVFDLDEIRHQMENTYKCPVAALMRYSEDAAYRESPGIFSLRYPQHEISGELSDLASQIAG